MKTTRQTNRAARQLFFSCHINGALDESRVHGVLQQLIEKRHRGFLAVLWQFKRLVRLETSKRTATIHSAVPLSTELQTQISQQLRDVYGQGIDIQFTHRPELIGGMRVQVGSDVFDGSVRHGLATLEGSF
jgi:F-type H+-transporting ATPase subunit delta